MTSTASCSKYSKRRKSVRYYYSGWDGVLQVRGRSRGGGIRWLHRSREQRAIVAAVTVTVRCGDLVAALLVHHVLFIVLVARPITISTHHGPYLIDLLRGGLVSVP